MWQKGSTFLAIVTPSYRFAPYRSPEKVFVLFTTTGGPISERPIYFEYLTVIIF
jgi:hypothetical protein